MSKDEKWDAILNEFRSTDTYKKSGGVALFPLFYAWLIVKYKAPNKKK